MFFVSSRSDVGSVQFAWDKMMHSGAYGLLCVFALRACHGGLHRMALRPTLVAVALTVGYGLLDELHQGTVPGRDASVLDWVADVAGVALAVAFMGLWLAVRAMRGVSGPDEGVEG
jgi:VanZ family protein